MHSTITNFNHKLGRPMPQQLLYQTETLRASAEASNELSPASSVAKKLSNKVTLPVGESRLEWPSFIKHFSSCRQLRGERRGAGVFTPRLSPGLQEENRWKSLHILIYTVLHALTQTAWSPSIIAVCSVRVLN